ncbi:hypothetical protein BLNAU_18008 [Blattamonas nauphoetae]|uniref:Uncharacterized protein n=1 Tax=Blattamonas nauphoetae TaxID=2049346 RepID=A0ABQ9X5X3_9EUKA|nr:hypothetical protein BLNAU_18008 [Blattamonas nauphoetae]
MLADKTSPLPPIDSTEAEQTNFLKVSLRQIGGDYNSLSPEILSTLLTQATESDLALSAILDIEYIKPLEEYCEKTQPCDVPISLPKLLALIGKSSEAECLRICESSIPSFLLQWMDSISDENILFEIEDCLSLWTSTLRSYSTFLTHHKTQFLAFLDHSENSESYFPHLSNLAQLCFSPHLEILKMALEVLSKRCKSDSKTCSFLRKLKVPSGCTIRWSELVPFATRLCSTLAELVSEMKSLFTESSPSDGTISALSARHPSESPHLSGNTVLEVLCEGISLFRTLFKYDDHAFFEILDCCNFVLFLKSTIKACLNLLDQQKTESNHPPAGRTAQSPYPIVEWTFTDLPKLCSLLERTCCHSSPTHNSHFGMLINFSVCLPLRIPRMLLENLVERVFITTRPMAVPTTHGGFHLRLIGTISILMRHPRFIAQDTQVQRETRQLQFEHVLKPAKQYLQFILPRDEFLRDDDSSSFSLSFRIGDLLKQTLLLERDLLEDGEIVESGREEWEVGWLVEKTNEEDLGERLKEIREDDVKMKKKEKGRWKKRAERRREAGHEDALEGWLTRKDNEKRSEIVEYIRQVQKESGMNHILLTGRRFNGYWM